MEELKNRTKAMTKQEKAFVLKFFETSEIRAELDRRTDKTLEVMTTLFGILDGVKNDMNLEDMQKILQMCREALKME